MNKQERMTYVKKYEKFNNVYMNFKLEEDGSIFGLVEGVRSQTSLITEKQLQEYENFLTLAIGHYEDMIHFDPLSSKQVKKYNTYMKRLKGVKDKKMKWLEENNFPFWPIEQIKDEDEKKIYIGLFNAVLGNGLVLANGETLTFNQNEKEWLLDDEEILNGEDVKEILADEVRRLIA